MFSPLVRRVFGGLVLLSLLALSLGCGPNLKARATVKGKVTFAGKSLTAGSVTFYASHNRTGSATIDKTGNYVMNDAPIGDVQITVTVPPVPPGGLSRIMPSAPAMKNLKESKSVDPENPGRTISIMGDMPTNVVPIPDKFSKVETSGLTYKVEKGDHVHNLDLKP